MLFGRKIVKSLAILTVVLLIVLACLHSWRSARGTGDAVSTDAPVSEGSGEKTLLSVTYTCSDVTLSFERDEKDGLLYWTADHDYPLDREKLETLERDLAVLSPTKVTDAADETLLETYGLDTPAYSLQATYSDESTLAFTVGKATEDGAYYFRYADEERAGAVYTVGASVVLAMNYGIYDMCVFDEIPTFTEENLRSVSVKWGEQQKQFRVKEQDGEYRWYLGAENVNGEAGVSELTETLEKLSYSACVVRSPLGDSLSVCGLATPAVTVSVTYEDANGREREYTLYVGGKRGETERFVRAEEADALYAMTEESLHPFLLLAGLVTE